MYTRRTMAVPVPSFVFLLLFIFLFPGCKKEPLTLAYFYSAACPSCEESRKLMETAGRVYGLAAGKRGIEVKSYDLFHDPGNHLETLAEYLREFNVPPERQALPILFVGDRYYQGSEEIEDAIRKMQAEGIRKQRN